jgi:hypothetical protein
LWRIHLLAEDESELTDMKRFIIASYDLYAHVPTYHGFMKELFLCNICLHVHQPFIDL